MSAPVISFVIVPSSQCSVASVGNQKGAQKPPFTHRPLSLMALATPGGACPCKYQPHTCPRNKVAHYELLSPFPCAALYGIAAAPVKGKSRPAGRPSVEAHLYNAAHPGNGRQRPSYEQCHEQCRPDRRHPESRRHPSWLRHPERQRAAPDGGDAKGRDRFRADRPRRL